MKPTHRRIKLNCPECEHAFYEWVALGVEGKYSCPECNTEIITNESGRGNDGPTRADARIRDMIKKVPQAPSKGVLFDRGDYNYVEMGRSDAKRKGR